MMPCIEIWNREDTERLVILFEDADCPDNRYFDLEITHDKWGFKSCVFKLKRDPDVYWPDLEDTNIVRVYGFDITWEGDIENVELNSEVEEVFSISCVGTAARVRNQGTDHDVARLLPSEKASTYIVDHVLTDTNLGLSAGTIDTNDYAIVSGIDFSPGKKYEDMFNTLAEYSGNRTTVWENRKLDWKPRETAPFYFVREEDCKVSNISRNRDGIINWVQVAFTIDNDFYDYVIAYDQDSIDRHGKRVFYHSITGSQAEAQMVADATIAFHKDLKPASSITTNRIVNEYGAEVDPWEIRSLKVLYIESIISVEEDLEQSLYANELNSWEIGEVSIRDGMVTLSPGEPDDFVAVMLKRQEDIWALLSF